MRNGSLTLDFVHRGNWTNFVALVSVPLHLSIHAGEDTKLPSLITILLKNPDEENVLGLSFVLNRAQSID